MKEHLPDNNQDCKVDAKFLGGYQFKSGIPTDGIDRGKIDEIITEASKGSKFYTHQQKREHRIAQRIKHLTERKMTFEKNPELLHKTSIEFNRWQAELEAERDLSQTFLHVDMDAFFAAVEELKRPELRGRPIAVGDKSMLSTANYEARKYGVVSAMPGYIAVKLCPQLTIIPCDYKAYKAASIKFRQIFADYDPDFSSFSLDEASLDISEYLAKRKEYNIEEVILELKRRVYEATQLTCSVGAACNRQLAKLCSNIRKPNGHVFLLSDVIKIKEFLQQQSVKQINGIGRVMTKILDESLKIKTCGDIIKEAIWIRLLFSKVQSEFLLCSALGLGHAFGEDAEDNQRKSMSVERTFKTMTDVVKMREMLQSICELLAQDLAKRQLSGRNISVKLKSSDFDVHTRAQTLEHPIFRAEELLQFAEPLLLKDLPKDLRLLGVRMSMLVSTSEEMVASLGQFRKLDEFIATPETHITARPECPVCGKVISAHADDEVRINEHIDQCLASTSPFDNSSSSSTNYGTGSNDYISNASIPIKKRPKSILEYFNRQETSNEK